MKRQTKEEFMLCLILIDVWTKESDEEERCLSLKKRHYRRRLLKWRGFWIKNNLFFETIITHFWFVLQTVWKQQWMIKYKNKSVFVWIHLSILLLLLCVSPVFVWCFRRKSYSNFHVYFTPHNIKLFKKVVNKCAS